MNTSAKYQVGSITVANNGSHKDGWEHYVVVGFTCEVAIQFFAIYLLLSVVTYGNRKNKWQRRRENSSLSSGNIYVAIALAIVLFNLRVILTQIFYILRFIENGTRWCRVLRIATSVASWTTHIAIYFGLWLKYRLIFSHPYVKSYISAWVKVLHYISLVACLTQTIFQNYKHVRRALLVKYVSQLCLQWRIKGNTVSNFVISTTLLLTVISTVIFSLYPSLKVKFQIDDSDSPSEGVQSRSCIRKATALIRYPFLYITGKFRSVSPVEMECRRTMLCGMIYCLSNVIGHALLVVIRKSFMPRPLLITIADFISALEILCLLHLLNYCREILKTLMSGCIAREVRVSENLHAGSQYS